MKVLRILLIIVVVIVGGYAAWMATIPAEYNLERTAEINASPDKVYNTVVDLKSWKDWNYWDTMDSTNVVTYDGNAGEVGSSYSWKGEQTGEGTFTIKALDENKAIDYSLMFVGMGESDGYFKFDDADGKTNVTYGFNTEFGFWDRIGAVFMDGMMTMAFDTSLANLKSLVEAMPDEAAEAEIKIEMMENTPVAYYSVTDQISMADMSSEFFATRYAELGKYLGEDAAKLNGAPFAIYREWDEENKMTTISVALPVSSEKEATDRIEKGMTHEGTVLKSVHMGAYEETGKVHYAMDDYVKANGLQLVGAPWEVYVTDPGTEPDTAKWVTEIYYPVMEASAEGDADSEETAE